MSGLAPPQKKSFLIKKKMKVASNSLFYDYNYS